MKLLMSGGRLRAIGHLDRRDDGEPTTLTFGTPEVRRGKVGQISGGLTVQKKILKGFKVKTGSGKS
jgi:hypothetical protein